MNKLELLFKELGVEYNKETHSKDKYDTTLQLDEGNGYMGFKCIFYFLKDDYVAHSIIE